MKTWMLPLLLLPLILVGAVVRPAPAEEDAQSVALYSNRKGDAGWIEVDHTDGRMQAIPYLRISGETVRRAVDTADRAGEAPVSVTVDPRQPDPTETTDRKTHGKDALASLLSGPDGVSLLGILDLARQASESARDAFRKVRTGEPSPPRPVETR